MSPAELSHEAASFALLLAIVFLAAKIGAEFSERVLRQPSVVGELLVGVAIGPFALGVVDLPLIGPLFDASGEPGLLPIPGSLWAFGQVAAVVLLFGAGLETDFKTFLRHSRAALVVAVGGVVVPFVLGVAAAIVAGFAYGFLDPAALFLGTVLTATSVGVTARVLSDLGRIDTPEAATILGAAVIDDVLGVILLGAVVAVSAGEVLDPGAVGWIAVQSVLLYSALALALLGAAGPVVRLIDSFRTPGAVVGIGLGLALLAGVAAEQIGLAMIIGSYTAGLAFSRTGLRSRLHSEIRIVQNAVVPAFFVLMGMLVDLRAMADVFGFAVVLTVIAVAGKLVGSGLPALAAGFNRLGAARIGVGMVPRGEVALVVAGVGLAAGVITPELFSVAVFIAISTTVVATVLLAPTFRSSTWGLRAPPISSVESRSFEGALDEGLARALERHLVSAMHDAGFRTIGTWSEPDGRVGLHLERGSELVGLWTVPQEDGQRSMRLETEVWVTDLDGIVSAAKKSAGAEVMAALDGLQVRPSQAGPAGEGETVPAVG